MAQAVLALQEVLRLRVREIVRSEIFNQRLTSESLLRGFWKQVSDAQEVFDRLATELVGELRFGQCFADACLAGGRIHAAQNPALAVASPIASAFGRNDGREVARLGPFAIELNRRREDAREFAAYDLGVFRCVRIADLITDGDLFSGVQKFLNIALHAVVGHARHRHWVRLVLVARGERDFENARRFDRVVVKELVEVAHAEKQNRVAGLGFDLPELFHQGGSCLEVGFRWAHVGVSIAGEHPCGKAAMRTFCERGKRCRKSKEIGALSGAR